MANVVIAMYRRRPIQIAHQTIYGVVGLHWTTVKRMFNVVFIAEFVNVQKVL